MRKIVFLIIISSLILTNCKKANKLTEFDINYTTTIIVPSTTGLNLPFNLTSPDMETNSDSKFQINNTRKDKVESITLKELELRLKSPSSGNFDFLKSIEIYIDAEDLQEAKVAWKDNITNGLGQSIFLNVSSANLKPYILKDGFNLRVRTVTDETITSDHEIEVNSTFNVDAKLL